MIELTNILETSLYVDDLDAARNFYGEILGLKEYSFAEGRNVFYQLENSMLLVFNPEATRDQDIGIGNAKIPTHGATGNGHMAFTISSDQIEKIKQELTEHGVEVESHVVWNNNAQSIYVRDPAGNCVEFATADLWYGN